MEEAGNKFKRLLYHWNKQQIFHSAISAMQKSLNSLQDFCFGLVFLNLDCS